MEIPLVGLPDQTRPFAAGEIGVLAIGSLWDADTEEFRPVEPWYAEHGQPSLQESDLPPEMEAANVSGMWMPMGAAVGDRYLVMLFEDDFKPTFWIKDLTLPWKGLRGRPPRHQLVLTRPSPDPPSGR